MAANPTLWMYFADAGVVVKTVMLLLVAASVVSWTMIFQRGFFLKKMRESIDEFEEKFWSGIDLVKLHFELDRKATEPVGLENIFLAGFDEFLQLRKKMEPTTAANMEMIQRAMRVAERRETEKLEKHLPFLASVGSISPYVGLFGTVWGIMTAFQALGSADQATIAMVAPGISEALVATAMGLFAAIPAVLAYNRYSNITERLLNTYESFQEEFFNVLVQRQQQGEK